MKGFFFCIKVGYAMRILISTKVELDYKTVYSRFDVNLFKKLKPPLVGLYVKRFDGCNKGDEVHIEINTLGIKQPWNALITENAGNEQEIVFVDEGIVLPNFIKTWKHTHRIVKNGSSSIIIDDIKYKTPNILLDFISYPVMYLQFFYRKPVYKSYFRK